MAKHRWLLTAFEPYEGRSENASTKLLEALRELDLGPEIELRTEVLPVDFERVSLLLPRLLERHDPSFMLGCGEAGGSVRLRFERVALNLIDARIPDNRGFQPIDQPVLDGGPTAYLATLPVKAMAQASTRFGADATVSMSAGTYVCNAAFYRLLHLTAGSDVKAGFLHCPWHEKPEGDWLAPAMPSEEAARGLAAALVEGTVRGQDLSQSAGQLH